MNSTPVRIVTAVCFFGALGGILRFELEHVGIGGTLLTNLVGSFALGFFYMKAEQHLLPSWLVVGISSGLLGSFTTFSAFINDTVQLTESSLPVAAAYLFTSLMGSFWFVRLGNWMAAKRDRMSQLQVQSDHDED